MKNILVCLAVGLCMLPSLVFAQNCTIADYDDTSETPEIQWTSTAASDLYAMATQLATPIAIYEYLRNNAEYALYHGSRSGSINTFGGLRGNDVDLASTLIAMLRSQGIHSRYVVGTVQVATGQVMNWLGVTNPNLAVSIMQDQGIQGPVQLSSDGSYIQFEHAWVEAYLPYGDYRGAGQDAASTACTGASTDCHWVALDPSFKQKTYNNPVDVYPSISFDYTSYYNAIKNGDVTRKNKNPLEIYENQVLAYVGQGKGLADVEYTGTIISENALILPASLPYTVVGTPRRYNSITEHDQFVPPIQECVSILFPNQPAETKKWAKSLTLTVAVPAGAVCPGGYPCPTNIPSVTVGPLLLTDLATQQLTLTDQPMAIRLGETQIGSFGEEYFIGYPITITINMDGAPAATAEGTDQTITAEYDATEGGYYLVATGGETSNWSQVHAVAAQLLKKSQSYAGDSASSLLGDTQAVDDLTGDLLAVAAAQYFTKMREDLQELDALNHVKTPISGYLGVVSSTCWLDSTNGIEFVPGTAFSILPSGLLIDMKAMTYAGSWRIDSGEYSNAQWLLFGHIASSLEHEIWQDLTGYDAISTVRGIQEALADGAALVNPVKNANLDTLPSLYPQFGFSTTPTTSQNIPYRSYVYDTTSPDAGYLGVLYACPPPGAPPGSVDCGDSVQDYPNRIVGYYTYLGATNPDQSVEILKQTVDSSTSTLRSGYLYYPFSATGLNFTNTIDSLFANLSTLYNQVGYINCYPGWDSDLSLVYGHYPNNYLMGSIVGNINEAYCTGGPGGTYNGYGGCYEVAFSLNQVNGIQTPGPSLWTLFAQNFMTYYGNYTEFFNFVDMGPANSLSGDYYKPSDYVFRSTASMTNLSLSVSFIGGMRNDLYDTFFDKGQFWKQYWLPTAQVAAGANYFTVDIIGYYETGSNNMVAEAYFITNNYTSAGGGYVDASQPLLVAQSITGTSNVLPTFNNSVFTDQNTVSITNNDAVKTPSTSDPVSAVTGNNYHDETDFTIKGRGLNFVFTRTYNSAPSSTSQAGPLGYGWTHSYNMSLTSNVYGACPNCCQNTSAPGYTCPCTLAPENCGTGTSSITFLDERGGTHDYLVNAATHAVTPPTGEFNTLALDTNTNTPATGFYTLTFGNGVQYVFQAVNGANLTTTPGGTARLVSINDPYGNSLAFTYTGNNLTSIKDTLGRALTLSYSGSELQSIADWTGRAWTYTYDSSGNLLSVTNPLGNVTTYTYAGGIHNLSQVTLPQVRGGGQVATTFTYYQNDKTFTYADTLGDTTTLDYDLFNMTTRVTDPRGFIHQYEYDQNGLLARLTDPDSGILQFTNDPVTFLRTSKTDGLGDPTSYSYDSNGNVTAERDSLGHALQYQYGVYDQVTQGTDRNNNNFTTTYCTTAGNYRGKPESITLNSTPLRSYTYNNDGTIATMTENITPDGTHQRVTTLTWANNGLNLQQVQVAGSGQTVTTEYTYDNLGRMTSKTVMGQTTTYGYDALDRVISVTDPSGNVAQTAYDGNGKITQTSYAGRIISTKTYGTADRLITNTDVYGNTTTYAYDASGNVASVTDPNGHVIRYQHDSMNRRIAVTDGNGFTTQAVYDLAGRPTQTINALGKATTTSYDAVGRPTVVTDPMGFQTTCSYDANGNTTSVTDANGYTTYKTYDDLNRVVQETDPMGGVTSYTYDLLGNMTSITDAQGNLTKFTYNDLGRLITVTDPLGKSTTFTYDEVGNVLARNKRSGAQSVYTYDLMNRLIKAVHSQSGQATITENVYYDAFGNVTSIGNGAVTYAFQYDLKNRMTQKIDSRTGSGLTYTYDRVGNIATKAGYDGTTTQYLYDSTNRLVSETNQYYLQVSYYYDGAGRLMNRTLSNGSNTSYTWDDDNRLRALVTTSANGTIIDQTTYLRDNVGNVTSRTDTSTTQPYGPSSSTFFYDPLYRLTSASYSYANAPTNNQQYAYTYDKVGNRLTMTNNGVALSYVYDGDNKLTQILQASACTPGSPGTCTPVQATTVQYQCPASGQLYGDAPTCNNTCTQSVSCTSSYQCPADGSVYGDSGTCASKCSQTEACTYTGACNLAQYQQGSCASKGADWGAPWSTCTTEPNGVCYMGTNVYCMPGYKCGSYQMDSNCDVVSASNCNVASGCYDPFQALSSPLPPGSCLDASKPVGTLLVNFSNFSYSCPLGNYPCNSSSYTCTSTSSCNTLSNCPLPNGSSCSGGTCTGSQACVPYNSASTGYQCSLTGTNYATSSQCASACVQSSNCTGVASTGGVKYSFSYDADGNMIQKNNSSSAVESVTYDAKGRAITILAGGQTDTFVYDPFDCRISKTDSTGTKTYLLEGESIEAVMSGPNWLAMYFRGVVVDEVVNGYQVAPNNAWVNYTFHHDNLQSVMGLSGHDGTVLQTIGYDPFGNKTATNGSATNNTLMFTGREQDPDTGLYYYRARYYDPTLGRFLTADPKGFAAGVNFYAYAGNNPINASDPYGLTNWWQVGSGFVEAGGAVVALGGAAFGEGASAGIGTPAALGLYFVAAPALAHGTVQIITGLAAKNDVTVPAVSLPALGAYVYTRGNQSSGDIPDLVYSAVTTSMGLGNWSRISDAASNVLGLLGTAGSAYSLYSGSQSTAPGNSSATDANNAAGLLLRGSTGTYNGSAPSVPLTYTGSPQASTYTDDSAAAGGYLIYPNKPNTNMTQSVYSK